MNKKYSLSLLMAVLASSGTFAQNIDEAKRAIKEENYDKAKLILKELIVKKPTEGANYFYMGDVFLRENIADSARHYFDKGLQLKNKGTLNLVGLGQLDLDSKKPKEAKAKFIKAIDAMKRKDFDEHLLVANAYLSSKNPDAPAAQKIAEVILKDDYQNASAFMILGRAYLMQDNLGKAYAAYRNAYEIDGSLLDAKLEMARINKKGRAYKEAILGCEELIAKDPTYAPVYKELGDLYFYSVKSNSTQEKEFLGKAAQNYKKYFETTNGSMDARMKYAEFLVQTENFEELEKITKEVIEEKGINPRIYRFYGYSQYEMGNYRASMEAFEKFLLAIDKSTIIQATSRDYMYVGLSAIAVGNNDNKALYEKGLKYLRDAVKIDPSIATYYNRIGLVFFREEKFQKVIDILSISADVKESDNYLYDNYYVGYSYYFLGKEDVKNGQVLLNKASEYLSKVIEVSPNTSEAYFFKARANRYINSKEAQKVMFDAYHGYIKVLKDKKEINDAANKDKVIEAHTSIATYYANNNENAKALEEFQKVLNLDPNNDFAKRTMATIKKGK